MREHHLIVGIADGVVPGSNCRFELILMAIYIAWPSNVIEAKAESCQGSHSAPFPRALFEFFVLAFSDAGDIVYDPFTGSGTSIAAAHVLGRVGYGIELSPAYCDVAVRRLANLTSDEPVLAETGQTMAEVAAERGVHGSQKAS